MLRSEEQYCEGCTTVVKNEERKPCDLLLSGKCPHKIEWNGKDNWKVIN